MVHRLQHDVAVVTRDIERDFVLAAEAAQHPVHLLHTAHICVEVVRAAEGDMEMVLRTAGRRLCRPALVFLARDLDALPWTDNRHWGGRDRRLRRGLAPA